MTLGRIICLGNRWRPEDAAGPLVYDRLALGPLPHGLEIVDGGLAGLDLLPWLEGANQVVFVDNVSGFGPTGRIMLLTAPEVARLAGPQFGHDSGLPYLLRILPTVCDGPLPRISILGLEGPPENREVIDRLAALALQLADAGTDGWSEMNAGPGEAG